MSDPRQLRCYQYVGQALDALVGHRIAEASVLRFLEEVATRINAELAATTGAA